MGAATAHLRTARVVNGRVYGARFRHPERVAEAPAYPVWFAAGGHAQIHTPGHVNEGEGDFAVVGELILAATGFRTSHAAHLETQEFLGVPVLSLTLVDPPFYHLDTALLVLDEQNVAYYPDALSAGSQLVLRRLFPDAVIATEADAHAFGPNSVSG